MNTISTHILDTARGVPAAGVPLKLEREAADGSFGPFAQGVTDADGRVKDLLPKGEGLAAGVYRMSFDTSAYFALTQQEGFYPLVQVQFTVRTSDQHYHVPLLLSPFGFSTYRGS
ncbi:MAG: transthyretin family protein [Cyanobacteria bacterium RYN_339]|nr:transthyretin family protein [Cyanobacteria bacterium RYN_339]